MIYELLSAVGGLGLLTQTFLGFAHGGHAGGHSTGPGSVHLHGHLHLHGHATGHAHGHLHQGMGQEAAQGQPATATGHPAIQNSAPASPSPFAPLLTLLSPLALFTICLGAGVTGLLLQNAVA